MLRAAVCDDDREYALWLREEILKLSGGGITVELYSDGEDLLEDAEQMHELVLLDMDMPGMDGMETAKRLRKENKDAVLVFISGVKTPTSESFKVSPYRYLLKQFERETMEEELLEVIMEVKRIFSEDFMIAFRGRDSVNVKLRDILYFSTVRGGSEVHRSASKNGSGEEKLIIRQSVKEVAEYLKEKDFALCHSSFLVNLRQVDVFSKKELRLKDGTVLSVSRMRLGEFEERMFEYWGRKYDR